MLADGLVAPAEMAEAGAAVAGAVQVDGVDVAAVGRELLQLEAAAEVHVDLAEVILRVAGALAAALDDDEHAVPGPHVHQTAGPGGLDAGGLAGSLCHANLSSFGVCRGRGVGRTAGPNLSPGPLP